MIISYSLILGRIFAVGPGCVKTKNILDLLKAIPEYI